MLSDDGGRHASHYGLAGPQLSAAAHVRHADLSGYEGRQDVVPIHWQSSRAIAEKWSPFSSLGEFIRFVPIIPRRR